MDKQYDSMTLVNLRELAKEKGLKNIAALKKADLIELLKKADEGDKQNESPKDEIKDAAKMQKSNSVQTVEKIIQKTENANQRAEKADQQSDYANQRVERADQQSSYVNHRAEKANQQSDHANQRTEKVNQRSGNANQRTEKINQRTDNTNLRAEKVNQRTDRINSTTEKANVVTEKINLATDIINPSAERMAYSQEKTMKAGENIIHPMEKVNLSVDKGNPAVERAQERTAAQMPLDMSQSNSQSERKATSTNDMEQLDSGETKVGILEVLPDGYGFIRCDNYLPGENDVYVSPAQIRRFNLKTGDIVAGNTRVRSQNEKFSALLFVKTVNGFHPSEAQKRKRFEDLTPVFPNQRIRLETPGAGVSMRMVDLVSPIGKGQRGMIVSQPKTGKTTLLKQIAKAVTKNHPDMKLIILLIDERPEEVTDIKESIEGKNVEVIYSTFDELPDNHKRVSEMVIERAKRLVEHKQDVIILLDSITRLARAYNLTVQPSGRTLSGGLDPAALHMPKKFFGAARNMREGGSLTILATALVDTGSRMDDVVFEEFKGTGNMELVLDRSLSEKRIFPAIDLPRSSTRREDLLLTQAELEATFLMRKALGGMKSEEALERIIDMFLRTKTNNEFIETIKKTKIVF
jgi:transcription termination factor Rho